MDEVRLGRSLRALRRRRGWTQARLGAAAGLSRDTVSRLERGEAGAVRIDALTAIAGALGARVDVGIRWRGEALGRLVDAAHADLVDRTVALLTRSGWELRVEVTFARYGERGSIDVLARREAALLVVEVKSAVPDLQAMLSTLDRKARLATWVAEQAGWRGTSVVGRLLVLPERRTVYRRLAEHRAVVDAAFPDRGWTARRWLMSPTTSNARPLSGIIFLPDARGDGTRHPGTARGRVVGPDGRLRPGRTEVR